MSQAKQKTFRAKKFSCFREAQIFFGPPPILSTENPQDYFALGQAIWSARRPKDFIEISWVNDITYLLWEVLRQRRMKPQLIDAGRFKALQALIKDVSTNHYSDSFWQKWQAGDEESRAKIDEELKRAGLGDEAITAKSAELLINILENFERQCSQLEARRLITTRESVQYRANIDARRERRVLRRRLGGRGEDQLLIEKPQNSGEGSKGDPSSEEAA